MIELRNSSGQLDFTRVTPEVIEALDEPQQHALLALMKATEVKDAAVARRNVATKRALDAVTVEEIKQQISEEAASPIPFSTAKIEADLGRPLNVSEMIAAREQHAIRVRGLREDEARRRAREAYIASH